MKPSTLLFVAALTAGAVLVLCQSDLTPAIAQGAPVIVTVIDSVTEHPSHLAIDSSGRLFFLDQAGWHFLAQCPPGRPADLRVAPYHGNNFIISMENGDVYTMRTTVTSGDPIDFDYLGNVFSGTTVPTQPRTWGSVKRGYRD